MQAESKMLTENQCKKIEFALTRNIEPRKVAAYLCLHLGLTVAEATALRFSDVCWENGQLTISRNIMRALQTAGAESGCAYVIAPADCPRTIPMPHYLVCFLRESLGIYNTSTDFYWITGGAETPKSHLLQNFCISINTQYGIGSTLTPAMLRDAFVRRCLVEGIDAFTIAGYVGMKQINEIQRRFNSFARLEPNAMNRLEKYDAQNIDSCTPGYNKADSVRSMNMIVLGAGDHGQAVMETAAAKHVFEKLDFLDDNLSISFVIGACSGFLSFKDEYPLAFPAFGNNDLRMGWVEKLEQNGFIIPTLIDNSAVVSPSAKIGSATIIETKAVVSSLAEVGKGCIISANVTVDVGVKIGEGTYVAPGLTIPKRAVIPPMTKLVSENIGQFRAGDEQ